MTTSVNKYAEYKIAPPLERRRLTQGKLNSSSERAPHDSHASGHSPLLSFLDRSSTEGLDSSPRRPLMPHLTADYSTTDHTHSLSLSDSDSPPPSTVHSHSSHPHTPTAVISHSSTESVVVVRAQDYSPSHSQPVKTTSTKTLSPVKVTRHVYQEDEEVFNTDITAIAPPDSPPPANGHDWKRFSSSFVPLPPTSTATGNSRTRDNGIAARQQDTRSPQDQPVIHVPDPVVNLSSKPSADNSGLEATHGEDVERNGVMSEAVRGGGVGRSASDHRLKTVREQENLPPHSKSMEMGKLTSTKKKAPKGRAVASRYMSASSSVRKPPLTSGWDKDTPLKSGTTGVRKNKTVVSKPPLRKPPDAQKPPSRVKTASTVAKQPSKPPVPSTPAHNLSGMSMSFSPSGMVTSTPAHPTGGANDGSFITMEMTGNDSYTTADTSKKQNEGADKIDELEYLYTRLLQATRLNVMSAQSLKTQDQEAKCQLYSLWKALEGKKQSNLDLMKSLETERRNLALDKTMDLQLQGLGPVASSLTHLERSYAVMARALDSTRHDFTLKGMLPVDEDQLTEELAESEELLADIMTDIRGQVQQVASYAESADEVVTTLRKELDQLESCWSTLESVTKLQLHEISLYLEDRQRTRPSQVL